MPELRKRLLVVSDSHGNYIKLNRIINQAGSFDVIIHCGDGANDLLHSSIPESVSSYSVSGNVDLMRMPGLDRERELTIEGINFFLAHGDLFGVKSGYDAISNEGLGRKADIVLFGHTHNQYLHGNSPILFNPGAANRGQYGIIELASDGNVSFNHCHLEE